MKKLVVLLSLILSIGAVLWTPATSSAVTVTAWERLADPQPFDPFNRNLARTRANDVGYFDFEGDDATIIAENAMSDSFGILSVDDVSYRHLVDWLDPEAGNFTGATLNISAFGVLGGNDVVFADTINLGPLQNGIFTVTAFQSSNPLVLNLLFADDMLEIFINKNLNANFLGNLNLFSAYESELRVSYEAVPEPATLLFLSSGLMGVAFMRRRAKH